MSTTPGQISRRSIDRWFVRVAVTAATDVVSVGSAVGTPPRRFVPIRDRRLVAARLGRVGLMTWRRRPRTKRELFDKVVLIFEHGSRSGDRIRLRDMTNLLEAQTARSASLTSSQLATIQRLWHIASLRPVTGYGNTLLAVAVASDPTLANMLPSVDFDDAGSVAHAVDALLQWRQRTFG